MVPSIDPCSAKQALLLAASNGEIIKVGAALWSSSELIRGPLLGIRDRLIPPLSCEVQTSDATLRLGVCDGRAGLTLASHALATHALPFHLICDALTCRRSCTREPRSLIASYHGFFDSFWIPNYALRIRARLLPLAPWPRTSLRSRPSPPSAPLLNFRGGQLLISDPPLLMTNS